MAVTTIPPVIPTVPPGSLVDGGTPTTNQTGNLIVDFGSPT